MNGLPVRAEEWPHGLRCMDCDRPLRDGDRYTKRVDSMIGDAVVTEIVCVPCVTVWA